MVKKVTDKLLIVLRKKILSEQIQSIELPVLDIAASAAYIEEYIREVAERVDARRHVYYEGEIQEEDTWSKARFIKYLPEGDSFGGQLAHAVLNGFKKGYGRIVVVSTDCPQITPDDIQKAFDLLNKKQAVLGPKSDGTVYLIGLSVPCQQFFQDKPWGTPELFKKLYLDLLQERRTIALLEEKNHRLLGEFLNERMKKEEEE